MPSRPRMAKKALGDVAHGKDPQADKQDRRDKDRHTFKGTVADYLAIKKRDVRGRTFTEKSRYLTDRYFGPLHGSRSTRSPARTLPPG